MIGLKLAIATLLRKSKSAIRESLQYGTFMSNICSISQPMSVNLVLKLSKHVDYTL